MSALSINDIEVSQWLNADEGFQISLGRVVAIHAFQMLCPGCVLHGIPQAQRLHATFSDQHVSVIGLHTVFEHHEAMKVPSLRAFLSEFRVNFPVGVDVPAAESLPITMRKFQLQGTPSWLIFDRQGNLQHQIFGQLDDLVLGAEIAKLALLETSSEMNIYRKAR